MRLFPKVIISIASIGLISWGSIVGFSEWSAYQQEKEAHRLMDTGQNKLVMALETINEPVGFCGTPRMAAMHTAKAITGLESDQVIELAANYARYNGVPVHAYDGEVILKIESQEKHL